MLSSKDKDKLNMLTADVRSFLTSVHGASGMHPWHHMLWGSGNAECVVMGNGVFLLHKILSDRIVLKRNRS